MINWQYFPKSKNAISLLNDVVRCFEDVEKEIASENHKCPSNEVLQHVSPYLERISFRVETGKKAEQRIRVPVLFGLNGNPEKTFLTQLP